MVYGLVRKDMTVLKSLESTTRKSETLLELIGRSFFVLSAFEGTYSKLATRTPSVCPTTTCIVPSCVLPSTDPIISCLTSGFADPCVKELI
jgi:hypothetical protein